MTPPEAQFKRVYEKFQQLLKLHLALQKESEKLKADLDRMNRRCEELAGETERLKRQSEITKWSGNNLDEQEKKDLEKRLNHYVREIDRCIALLNE
jgi:hypothetical protein